MYQNRIEMASREEEMDQIHELMHRGLHQDIIKFNFYSSEGEPAVSNNMKHLILELININLVYIAYYYLYESVLITEMSTEYRKQYCDMQAKLHYYRDPNSEEIETRKTLIDNISELNPLFDIELYEMWRPNTCKHAEEIIKGVEENNDEIISAIDENLESMNSERNKNRIKMSQYLRTKLLNMSAIWRRRRLAVIGFAKANPPNNNDMGAEKGGARRSRRTTKRRALRHRRKHNSRKN